MQGLLCLQLPHQGHYVVDIATESLRRNRQHLVTIKGEAPVAKHCMTQLQGIKLTAVLKYAAPS